MDNTLKKYFAEIGARGGRAKSPAKIEAGRKNLDLARQKRKEKLLLNPRHGHQEYPNKMSRHIAC